VQEEEIYYLQCSKFRWSVDKTGTYKNYTIQYL